MRSRGLITLLVALGIAGGAPAAASANTETATAGNVTAQLSYTPTSLFYKDVRVKIVRGGATLIDQAAPNYPGCPSSCLGGPAYGGQAPSVQILQLDSTADPEVVFDFNSGGAHCCFYSQIFAFKNGAYTGIVHPFGDPGYVFFDPEKDGRFEFKSGNPAFAYAFGSFASTRFPPQIWRFSNGQMVDVTRQYPAIIRADLKRLRHQFKKFKALGIKPLLAAYAADQFMLLQPSKGFELVRKAKRLGYLKNAGKFLRHLERFLIRTGYETPPND
jgi:hypothetical protein